MRQNLSAQINAAITFIILLVVALTPLIFTSATTEFFETPKLIVLISAVLILLVLWSVTWILQGKVLISRTPLDVPLLLLLGVVVLSTIFSSSQYISIFGNFPRVHGSAVAWVSYILFYFVAASHLRTQNQTKLLSVALLISGTIVSLISLMSYFGAYLPLSFAKTANFTPTGSSFSTTAFLVLLLPLLVISLVKNTKIVSTPFAIVSATLFGLTIALTGTLATQLAAVFVLALTVVIIRKDELQRSLAVLAIPVVISVFIWVLGFIPGSANILNQKMVNFPREIQPSFSVSWQVAASTFRDAPFLGTGPSTYLFNYTQYKPVSANLDKFWNLRFDTAYNEFLQELGTIGGLGLLALVFLAVVVIGFGWSGLSTENSLAKALSMSALTAIVIMFFHTTSAVMMITLIGILAMLMAVHKSTSGKVEELSIGIKAAKLTDSNLVVGDILPYILFLPIFIFVAVAGWYTISAVHADVDHRLALNAASTRGKDTYDYLVQAERLNPYIDLYRTDLAQTNFALANAIAAAKGPTQASPSGSLTDSDKALIQQLLSQSITEAKVATTIAPRSAQDWEILASIYRQISGVAQNALDFALSAYGNAIKDDPYNPVLRVNAGGVYYSVKNYDLATRFFSDAANLKPDYANAYYNWSIALRDQGNLQDAETTAEQVVSLLQTDTSNPDYKTASAYLADLKARIATGSAQKSNITAPAANQNTAIQKTSLNNAVDLGTAPKYSTPSAVKKTK